MNKAHIRQPSLALPAAAAQDAGLKKNRID